MAVVQVTLNACASMPVPEADTGLTSALFSHTRLLQSSSINTPRSHSSTANAIHTPSSQIPE